MTFERPHETLHGNIVLWLLHHYPIWDMLKIALNFFFFVILPFHANVRETDWRRVSGVLFCTQLQMDRQVYKKEVFNTILRVEKGKPKETKSGNL